MDWVSGRYSIPQLADRYGYTPAYVSKLLRENDKMQELLRYHLEQLRLNVARGQMLVGQQFADIVQHGLNLARTAQSESVQSDMTKFWVDRVWPKAEKPKDPSVQVTLDGSMVDAIKQLVDDTRASQEAYGVLPDPRARLLTGEAAVPTVIDTPVERPAGEANEGGAEE